MNKIKLGDILAIQHGFAFKSQNYVDDSNYALVTLANISSTNNFQYNKANMTFYGADFPKEYILKENDLIMPLTEQSVGLFGNTAFVPFTNNITFVLNQRVGKVIPKEEKTTKYYLHYLLSCEYVKKQLEYRASGTRQRNISPKDIYDVEVFIPEYNIQKKIGSLLYNIEQKININNKISDELEDMAKTIYNYWFLQFEFPNEEGKPYKSSGGKMIWNEVLKREIPEGWDVQTLENLGNLIMGQSPKSTSYNNKKEGLPLINGAAELQKDKIEITKYTSEPTRICKKEDLIFCIRATIGNINYADKSYCLGRGVGAFRVTEKEYVEYMFLTLRNILNMYNKILTGSIIVGITKEDLLQQNIIKPKNDVITQFYNKVHFMAEKMKSIKKENQELTSLRDFLLPLLMNGQVGFKEDKAEG